MRLPSRSLSARTLLLAAIPMASTLLLSCSAPSQEPTPASTPPKGSTEPASDPVPSLAAAAQGVVTATDARNVPKFMWALRDDLHPSALATAKPEVAARAHIASHAATYGLSSKIIAAATLQNVHEIPGGASIVTFNQAVDGIDVYGVKQTVVMDATRRLIAITGSLHPAKHIAGKFELSHGGALAEALSNRYGEHFDETSLESAGARNGYEQFELAEVSRARAERLVDPATVKRVYAPQGDTLVAAYFIEFLGRSDGSSENDGWRYIVNAKDGRIIERSSTTQNDSFNYRVWADTTGNHTPADGPSGDYSPHKTGMQDGSKPAPLYVAPTVISMEGFNKNPSSAADPWLPPTATETTGNNVDAYTDSNSSSENGYTPASGDVRATAVNQAFDYTYDPTKDPQYVDPLVTPLVFNNPQRMAAVTQLFYTNNWLHDYWYDSGFDEKSGNAQLSNLGRGGLEGDPLKVEAQDDAPWGTRNNANMNTSAEGTSPRMQMYVWSGVEVSRSLTATGLTLTGPFAVPTWGPQNFDVTALGALAANGPPVVPEGGTEGGTDAASDVKLDTPTDIKADTADALADGVTGDASDGGATSNTFACGPVTSAVAGKIAIVDEGGGCAATAKIANVQAAGALGMIVVSAGGTMVAVTGRAKPSIPTYGVTAADGALIKTALAPDGASLSLTMKRVIGPENDGTIDNTIIAHEWGHYIHHRLELQCGNTQCNAMSEGWGDAIAMHMVAREGDDLDGSYAMSPYAAQGIEIDPFYFGIRRAPYSVDFRKNAMTFRHIQNGEPLPTTTPMSPSTAVNSEVHAAGEIWAEMLHEAHVALLRESIGAVPRYTWTEAHRRMANYMVAGMKITPPNPTYTEQRDGILAAAAAADRQDLLVLAKAFARRGAGTGAKSPATDSTDLVGVVESFVVKGDIKYMSASLDESVKSCDMDGNLDGDEEGLLTVKFVNNGVAALTQTKVTVTTPVLGITLENGGVVSLPTLEPFQQATVRLQVSLDNTFAQKVLVPFSINLSDPEAFNASTSIDFPVWVNRDNVPDSSASDDVESTTPVWKEVHLQLPTADGGVAPDAGAPTGTDLWARERTTGPGANNQWHGTASGLRGDDTLVSPVLNVASTGNLVMTFQHAYSFEFRTTAGVTSYFDGAVIEYSDDGGVTWNDIATLKDPGYNATLTVPAGGAVDNPLQGRKAFAATSTNFPTLAAVSVDLGTSLAGKNIQIRFRVGTDTGTGGPGWYVDNIGFQGITNKPFPSQQADSHDCVGVPIANAGPDQNVAINAAVTLNGAASTDPVGGPNPLTYAWDQLSGPTVAVTGGTTVSPTFTAPATPSVVTMRLIVSDGPHGASDTVNIIVAGGGTGTDGGTDAGDAGRDSGTDTGSGGTDGGRDGSGGGDAINDVASDRSSDATGDSTGDVKTDARTDASTDAGDRSGDGSDDGCGCRLAAPQPSSSTSSRWFSVALGALGLLVARRRRR